MAKILTWRNRLSGPVSNRLQRPEHGWGISIPRAVQQLAPQQGGAVAAVGAAGPV